MCLASDQALVAAMCRGVEIVEVGRFSSEVRLGRIWSLQQEAG